MSVDEPLRVDTRGVTLYTVLDDYALATTTTKAAALFCYSLSTLSQKSATAAEFGDSRRFLRESHFCETVWTGLYSYVV